MLTRHYMELGLQNLSGKKKKKKGKGGTEKVLRDGCLSDCVWREKRSLDLSSVCLVKIMM